MLNDELQIWHSMIDILNPGNSSWVIEKPLNDFERQLKLDRKTIQDAWIAASFTESSDALLRRYYLIHKKQVILHIERLTSYIEKSEAASDRYTVLNLMIAELQELLSFLNNYFPHYLGENDNKESSEMVSIDEHLSSRMILNLSVAQLACLIRLFYKTGYFPYAKIVEVIDFFATHFESKKRSPMSPGNLSKEYYGVTQKTAASMIAILEQMIKELKRQFFPD